MSARWITLLCLLALSACGGGGGGGDPPAQPTPPAAPAPPAQAPTPVTGPSALSYSLPSAYTVGAAITALMPVVTGTVTAYSVSPPLPVGLALDTSTGQISGTPTAAAAGAAYVVTASNSGGSTTFALTLTVNPALAPPSALSYPSPQIYTVGTAIAELLPTVTGTVASYASSPALPGGLLFNTKTGQIIGTPNTAKAEASYTITAANAAGSTTFALVITINAPAGPPPAPTLTFTAPSPITAGGTATLTWTSTGAQTCSGSGGWTVAVLPTNGSAQVPQINGPTTFAILCSGPGGTITRSVVVNVVALPQVVLTPNRTKVAAGVKVKIEYRISHAAQCTPNSNWIAPITAGGVGSQITGSREVGPINADTDFGLTCSNASGQTTASVRIVLETEPNAPPVAVDDTYSVLEHTSAIVRVPYSTLAANDSDPEGRLAPLEYTEWNLTGGNSSVNALYVGEPAIGFTLFPDAAGPVTFRYRIEDDVGQKSNYATLTVTITPVDDLPVAVSDTAGGIRDIALDINVTQNDQNLDLPVTIQVSTAPTRGTASVATQFGRQIVRYVPNAGYEGADTLQYLLTDSDGDTTTATVAVTVGPVLRISPAARFARLGVARPQDWTCDSATDTALAWSNRIYGFFKDSFDFIVFLDRAPSTCTSALEGQEIDVKNDVVGIGTRLFNNTSFHGSAGRLRGIVWLAGTGYLISGPALHEIAHNWANDIVDPEPFDVGAHWGFSSGGGQLGGFALSTLEDLGGGLYRANNGSPGATSFGLVANGGNAVPYSEIELYLMGLREPAGVPDLVIARGGADYGASPGTFTATSLERLTIQDIIALHGARTPSFATSPKEFRVLTVVVTSSEMTQSEYDSLDLQVEKFGRPGDDGDAQRYNFWEATRGVGRLLMEGIDQELK